MTALPAAQRDTLQPAIGWTAVTLGMLGLLGIRVLETAGSGAGLHVDEAQYWLWSRDLQWGYFSKPPLIAALIRASTTGFGDSTIGVRLLAMICWIAASAGLWRVGCALGRPRAGLFAGVLLAASPASGMLGLVATTDAPLVLLWVATMHFTLRACLPSDRPAWGWWVAAGISLGLAMLAKYTAAILILSVIGWTVLFAPKKRPQRITGAILAGALALMILLPHLLWSQAHGWPTLGHTVQITLGQAGSSAQGLSGVQRAAGSVTEFLLAQWVLLGPTSVILVALASRRAGGPGFWSTGEARKLGLIFALPLMCVVTLQAATGKAQINWAAPALAPLCLLLGDWIEAQGIRLRTLAASAGVGLIFCALVALGGDFRLWLGRPAAVGQSAWDIWGRMRGWHDTLMALEPVLREANNTPWVTSDRTVHAQLAFELKHLNAQMLSWNPGDSVRHHFDWTQGIHPSSPASDFPEHVMYIDSHAPDPKLRHHYPSAQRLAAAQSGRVHLEVWSLSK